MVMLPSIYTAHPYGLFLGGLDVIKEPATPSRYGVPVESIEVVEAGPGGVSSMRFTLEDPSLVITIDTTCEVIYWDFTRDVPVFGGHIDRVKTTNDFGDQGRRYEIQCSGYETYLDTCVIDALTINFNTALDSQFDILQEPVMLQLLCGFGPLRQFSNWPNLVAPSQAAPLGPEPLKVPNPVSVTFTGLSIRQAYELYLQNCIQATTNLPFVYASGGSVTSNSQDIGNSTQFLTVDFYKGVRWHNYLGWRGDGNSVLGWTDYTTLTISDTPTGTRAAEGLSYESDSSPGAIVNGAYVLGTSGAGIGWVGSGLLPRRETSVSGASTTIESRRGLAASVMTEKLSPAGRGSFQMTSYTPVNGIHPGSSLTMTDARQGWTAKALLITQIAKTMNPDGTQNWTVDFLDPAVTAGGAAGPPSMSQRVRTLTRGTN